MSIKRSLIHRGTCQSNTDGTCSTGVICSGSWRIGTTWWPNSIHSLSEPFRCCITPHPHTLVNHQDSCQEAICLSEIRLVDNKVQLLNFKEPPVHPCIKSGCCITSLYPTISLYSYKGALFLRRKSLYFWVCSRRNKLLDTLPCHKAALCSFCHCKLYSTILKQFFLLYCIDASFKCRIFIFYGSVILSRLFYWEKWLITLYQHLQFTSIVTVHCPSVSGRVEGHLFRCIRSFWRSILTIPKPNEK